MGLNIKSDEAHRLAQELAGITGESMTSAVTIAIKERLERTRKHRKTRFDRMLAIAEDAASRMKEPWKSVDHGEMLYDELGLPK